MYRELVRSELQVAGLSISNPIQEKLTRYCELVSHWNRRVNLTGLAGVELVRRLVVEPVWIADRAVFSGSLIDVGSGNGSPAIPIALTRQLERTDLVEARAKRAAFLRQITVELQMSGVHVHKDRIEDAVEELVPADWVTMQAVAPTADILGAIRRVLKPTTHVVWITSGMRVGEVSTYRRLKVPFSNTEALWLTLATVSG